MVFGDKQTKSGATSRVQMPLMQSLGSEHNAQSSVWPLVSLAIYEHADAPVYEGGQGSCLRM